MTKCKHEWECGQVWPSGCAHSLDGYTCKNCGKYMASFLSHKYINQLERDLEQARKWARLWKLRAKIAYEGRKGLMMFMDMNDAYIKMLERGGITQGGFPGTHRAPNEQPNN